jgi:hypothetical protein
MLLDESADPCPDEAVEVILDRPQDFGWNLP